MNEIQAKVKEFREACQKYLPKVDRKLIVELILQQEREPNVKPMFTVEAFVKKGVDTEKVRNEIIRVTGMAPSFHDKGTHIVAHHKLDFDLLKQINDVDYVLEVRGTYTGSSASMGPSHEPTHEHKKR